MTNEETVIAIFALMHKLRNTKRKGWYDENIKRCIWVKGWKTYYKK